MKPKLYFGHPINVYNTPKEDQLVRAIKKEFPQFEVENPNQPCHQEGYKSWKKDKGSGMEYYFQIVLPEMSGGIFLPFEDGMLGKGVYGEAEFLANEGKPIFEIDLEGRIKGLELNPKRCLTVEQTRERVYKKTED